MQERTITIDTHDVPQSRVWRSCCLNVDKAVVLWATKTFFTASILFFAGFSFLSNEDPCRDMSFQTGLIGMVAGSVVEQTSRMMQEVE
jgi:hypothetical protein